MSMSRTQSCLQPILPRALPAHVRLLHTALNPAVDLPSIILPLCPASRHIHERMSDPSYWDDMLAYSRDASSMPIIPIIRLSLLHLMPALASPVILMPFCDHYILYLRLRAAISRLSRHVTAHGCTATLRLIRFALSLPPVRIPAGISTGAPYGHAFPTTNSASFPRCTLLPRHYAPPVRL